MKAVTSTTAVKSGATAPSAATASTTTGLPTPKIFVENKVTKSSRSPSGHKFDAVSQEEMQALLAKLKDLVPNMPRNKKLSKLEIIQNVIDYIFDLQVALETTAPVTVSPTACEEPNTSSSASLSPTSRQPLGVLEMSQKCNALAYSAVPLQEA